MIGAFDRYRNDATHEDVLMGRDETLEELLLANHCLRIVGYARPHLTAARACQSASAHPIGAEHPGFNPRYQEPPVLAAQQAI